MAPAQGWHAQIEKCITIFLLFFKVFIKMNTFGEGPYISWCLCKSKVSQCPNIIMINNRRYLNWPFIRLISPAIIGRHVLGSINLYYVTHSRYWFIHLKLSLRYKSSTLICFTSLISVWWISLLFFNLLLYLLFHDQLLTRMDWF